MAKKNATKVATKGKATSSSQRKAASTPSQARSGGKQAVASGKSKTAGKSAAKKAAASKSERTGNAPKVTARKGAGAAAVKKATVKAKKATKKAVAPAKKKGVTTAGKKAVPRKTGGTKSSAKRSSGKQLAAVSRSAGTRYSPSAGGTKKAETKRTSTPPGPNKKSGTALNGGGRTKVAGTGSAKSTLKGKIGSARAVAGSDPRRIDTLGGDLPVKKGAGRVQEAAVPGTSRSTGSPKTVDVAATPRRSEPAKSSVEKNSMPAKAQKEKVQIEFMVRSAPTVLFELISTPSGFSEWYCDDVNVRGDEYTFIWPGEEETTTLIGRKIGEVIRFHRNDDEDENSYFEFRVRIDAMTNEVALIVTDHAWPHEVDATRNLWNTQIANLLRVLGA